MLGVGGAEFGLLDFFVLVRLGVIGVSHGLSSFWVLLVRWMRIGVAGMAGWHCEKRNSAVAAAPSLRPFDAV